MKHFKSFKVFMILIIIFLITGCSKDDYFLNMEDVKQISFNNIVLLKEDSAKIIYSLNSISFIQDKNINIDSNDELVIYTKDDIYKLNFKEGYIVFDKNGHKFYAENTYIIEELEEIYKKYTDLSFYKIDYVDDYTNYDGVSIKVDNVSAAIILNFKVDVLDFKIHELDYIDTFEEEIGLLFYKDKIDSKVIIRYEIKKDTNIKIRFKTKYNMEIAILPHYEEDGNIFFETSIIKR